VPLLSSEVSSGEVYHGALRDCISKMFGYYGYLYYSPELVFLPSEAAYKISLRLLLRLNGGQCKYLTKYVYSSMSIEQ
jgi:hypothetical protein